MSKPKDIMLSEVSGSEDASALSSIGDVANCYISFELASLMVSSFEPGLEATRVEFQQ